MSDEFWGDELDNLSDAVKRIRRGKTMRLIFRTLILIVIVLLIIFLAIPKTSFGGVLDIVKIFKGGRYLVLLGNNSELRPSGGFIGSFAILNTNDLSPTIEYFETNIYDKDNEFVANNFVELPEPLQEILGEDTSWQLHDSNWSSNFSESAETALWFYNQEYNDSLDGVILINATVIRDLLALTGPVSSPNSNIELDYDTFFPALTNAIENDYWDDPRNEEINEPKTVLKDFLPALQEKTLALPKWTLWNYLSRALERKDVVFYNNDIQKEKMVVDNGWSREIDTTDDFLYITNATVGSKTSLSVEQNTKFDIDAKTRNATLEIKRTHNGTLGDYDGAANINYTLIHLPEDYVVGDTALDGKVIDVDKNDYNGYKTYGFWTTLEPGNKLEVAVDITLPERDISSLDILKQSGSANETIDLIIGNSPILSSVPLDHDLSLDF